MTWTSANIPELTGKTILITGANSGLGLESTKMLAGRGAHVIMACRNPQKAEGAAEEVRAVAPKASLELAALDLSNLASVREFAKQVSKKHERLDVLMNNAGIMAIPYGTTADGFELQFGTNHLGHFALTGLLFELLSRTEGARIVNVSSQAHNWGSMRFEDLAWTSGYHKWRAYGMSKLSNLLFTYEMARRLTEKSLPLLVSAAHPGYSATNLQYVAADVQGQKLTGKFLRLVNPLLGQPAALGALPQVYAAVAPEAEQGGYYGPDGAFGARGYPTRAKSNRASHDADAMRRLWDESERLTGVRFAALA